MELWICLVLLLIAVLGIVFLSLKLSRSEHKAAYIVGIVFLSMTALALIAYMGLVVILLSGIR